MTEFNVADTIRWAHLPYCIGHIWDRTGSRIWNRITDQVYRRAWDRGLTLHTSLLATLMEETEP